MIYLCNISITKENNVCEFLKEAKTNKKKIERYEYKFC